MRSITRRSFVVLGPAAVCCVALYPVDSSAQDGGSVRLVRQSIRERQGAWLVLMLFTVPKQPKTSEIVLRLRLTQTTDFVASGDPNSPRHVPVDPPLIIGLEKTVDMKGIEGRVERSGRAEFSLARQGGFRAGIWMLRVEGPDGALAAPVRITLEGVNEPGKPSADK